MAADVPGGVSVTSSHFGAYFLVYKSRSSTYYKGESIRKDCRTYENGTH